MAKSFFIDKVYPVIFGIFIFSLIIFGMKTASDPYALSIFQPKSPAYTHLDLFTKFPSMKVGFLFYLFVTLIVFPLIMRKSNELKNLYDLFVAWITGAVLFLGPFLIVLVVGMGIDINWNLLVGFEYINGFRNNIGPIWIGMAVTAMFGICLSYISVLMISRKHFKII